MPEIILLVVFCIVLLILKIKDKGYRFALSARIAMSVMLFVTAVAHFVFTKGMVLILPDFIPGKIAVVYLTGVLEAMASVGILISKYQKTVGWLLIVFFVVIFSANIYATLKHVNMESATFNGDGPFYLWYRVPLQVFFVAWVYFSCIKIYWPTK